jgi:hypothetical protein
MKRATTFFAALAIAVAAAACSQTDAGVTSKIKSSYAQDDLVKAHEINVTTREGVVTLTGEVPSMEARQQAVRLARETEGVTDVIDQLAVDVAATTGDADDVDVDVDVDDDLERGARRAGEAIREGADATADAARKAGAAARDAVTDDDPDSDNDGK